MKLWWHRKKCCNLSIFLTSTIIKEIQTLKETFSSLLCPHFCRWGKRPKERKNLAWSPYYLLEKLRIQLKICYFLAISTTLVLLGGFYDWKTQNSFPNTNTSLSTVMENWCCNHEVSSKVINTIYNKSLLLTLELKNI